MRIQGQNGPPETGPQPRRCRTKDITIHTITITLCNHVEVQDGGLHLDGAGWITCPAEQQQISLAITVESTPDLVGVPAQMHLTLEEIGGEPIPLFDEHGTRPRTAQLEFSAEPSPHPLAPSVTLVGLTMPLIELVPGAGYQWIAHIEDDPTSQVVKPFYVLEATS